MNKFEELLLGKDHIVIRQYERTLEESMITAVGKLESSVDKPQIPDFAKRQGAQEAVDEGRKLRKRYEDLNWLKYKTYYIEYKIMKQLWVTLVTG